MAARSKNKYDVYEWIKNQVIPSCTNSKHYNPVNNLIYNFQKTYNDSELTRELNFELNWRHLV